MERVISAWTFYDLESVVRHLPGVTHIGHGAAERIAEEIALCDDGTVLNFATRTQPAGQLIEGLGLTDEPVSERTWSIRSVPRTIGDTTYRLELNKIKDVFETGVPIQVEVTCCPEHASRDCAPRPSHS